ncbi:MAG: TetR/AcrR family transcriptional regulator [Burkholderiaceae bacterium]|nr:TetR/AcrR family transcriptional regulator [Burkholderiaceae bacterium]
MARPKAPDYEQHRARILELAVQAFARNGFPNASMASLARDCGTSKAALYHYFPSKDALLFEALDAYTRRLLAQVRGARAASAQAGGEIAAIVRTLMAEYRSSRAYHVAMLNDVRFLEAAQRTLIRRQERDVVEEIAAAIERAYPRAVNRDNRVVVTMALLGMINFTFAWLRSDGAVGHAQFADMVIALWSKGLGGADGPFLEGIHSEQAIRLQG